MKSFKFKDLMINVGSAGVQDQRRIFCYPITRPMCLGSTNGCFDFTCYVYTPPVNHVEALHCPTAISVPMACQFGTGTITIPTFTPIVDPENLGAASEQLAAVKGQLQEALRQVEARQVSLEASLQPQTVAEVEELQTKLQEAGSELERRKQELQRKSTK